MRPLRLKLIGFAGIYSGLGKSEVEIDFRKALPSEAQMVALVGPNGAGKSTIMDNLHPFRIMPSRATSLSVGGFSYYDNIVGGDASKELDWEHQGVSYRSVLRFKSSPSGKTRKQECYLFVLGGAQPEPWKDLSTGLTSDGKAENYDACVESILGKPEAFFTAQFSAQNKKPVGAMTATEVKKLFGSMLGYEYLESLSAKAGETYKELRPYLTEAQARHLELTAKRPNVEHVTVRKNALLATRASLSAQRIELRDKREAAMQRLAKLNAQFEQQEAIKSQTAALDERINDATQSRDKQLAEMDAKHASDGNDLRASQQQAQQAVASAKARVGDLQSRIQAAKQVMQKAPSIEQAGKQRQELLARRGTLVATAEANELNAMKVATAREQIQELTVLMQGEKAQGIALAEALKLAQATAALLTEVPCQGTDMAGQCKLLAQANAAAGEVPERQVKLENARSEMGKKIQKRQTMVSHFDSLVAAEAAFNEAKAKITEVDARIADLREVLALRPQVEEAQKSLPNLQQQLQDAIADEAKAASILAGLDKRLDGLHQQQQQQRDALSNTLQRVVQSLLSDRAALPPVLTVDALDDAKKALGALSSQEGAVDEGIDKAESEIGEVNGILSGIETMDGQIAKAKERADAISAEMAQWKLLSTALGTNGIIAMSIDDAGPAIAEKANQLLDDCYGGRFTLSLLTQEETAGGIQKETFQIMVNDNHRGEAKLIDAMSGGEKVWINECLVRGIALHLAEASDKQFQTLFADEADGPLDPDRKRQFMSMKRAVLARGGYDREFIVTQTPELVELCDAAIDVTQL